MALSEPHSLVTDCNLPIKTRNIAEPRLESSICYLDRPEIMYRAADWSKTSIVYKLYNVEFRNRACLSSMDIELHMYVEPVTLRTIRNCPIPVTPSLLGSAFI
jgi:hypothetical protein